MRKSCCLSSDSQSRLARHRLARTTGTRMSCLRLEISNVRPPQAREDTRSSIKSTVLRRGAWVGRPPLRSRYVLFLLFRLFGQSTITPIPYLVLESSTFQSLTHFCAADVPFFLRRNSWKWAIFDGQTLEPERLTAHILCYQRTHCSFIKISGARLG